MIVKCDKCHSTKAEREVLKVFERVTGKATQYKSTPAGWCGQCRAIYQGKWKYAK